MSYGRNLVHGERTSQNRVGPYRFCSGGTPPHLSSKSFFGLLRVYMDMYLLQKDFGLVLGVVAAWLTGWGAGTFPLDLDLHMSLRLAMSVSPLARKSSIKPSTTTLSALDAMRTPRLPFRPKVHRTQVSENDVCVVRYSGHIVKSMASDINTGTAPCSNTAAAIDCLSPLGPIRLCDSLEAARPMLNTTLAIHLTAKKVDAFASVTHWLYRGIVLGWAPIGFAAPATPRPTQYYFGHT